MQAKMFEIKEEFTMRSEIDALRRVGGRDAPQCIVKLHEPLEDDVHLYLVLELCRGSDIERESSSPRNHPSLTRESTSATLSFLGACCSRCIRC